MQLSINLFMTFDGVSQGPGSPDEDTRNMFTHGGWLMPFFDEECDEIVHGWFERSEALLLGRHTFDTFASHWPQVTDPTDLVANRINNQRKYVVTSRPLGDTWTHTTTALTDRFNNDIARLKDKDADGELQVHGSVQLAQTLHQAGLVDVYRFLIAPIVVGQGARLFDNGVAPRAMRIETSSTTSSGVHAVEMRPEDVDSPVRAAVQDGRDVIVDA